MDNIVITWNTILQFFGALAIIGGGIKVILSALNPYKEVKAQVKKHEEYIKNDNSRFEEIDKTLDEIKDEQRVQGRAIMVLINHLITGNNTDKLKKTYESLVEHYVDM